MAEIDLSEYRDMSTRLKTASRSLKTRMNKRLRDLGRPVAAEVIRELTSALPKRGGLADNVSTARVLVSINAAGISLSLGGRSHRKGEGQLRQIDDTGLVRHPVFGRYRRASRIRRGKLVGRTVITSGSGWRRAPWSVTKTRARGRGTAAFLDQKEKIQAALGDEVGKIVRELQ